MSGLGDDVLRLFADLPRQGPGSDRDTIAVLDLVRPHLPAEPRVADFGCGTGRSTLILATELGRSTVHAIDAVPLFVDRLRQEAGRRGLAGRLRPVVADMLAPPLEPGTVDLVWSEGAAYAAGFETALRAWRPLLRAQGFCVLSECEWFSEERPANVAAFWRETYPDMGDRARNTRRAEDAGYDVVSIRPLSEEGWSTYYEGLSRALAQTDRATIDPAFRDGILREIEVRREGEGSFGYTFYVLRRR